MLDTHILIWWATGALKKLSSNAIAAIDQEMQAGEIIISSISAWEIAMLINKDRIVISMDLDEWLSTIEQIDAVKFYAVDNDIAIKSANLPGEFHKDLADRMIVATARKLGSILITADEKIINYPHVKTIW